MVETKEIIGDENMNVKDLLLKQNRDDLIDRTLQMFGKKDETDKDEYHKKRYHKALMDMESLEKIEDKEHLVYGMVEHDVNDCQVTEHKNFSIIRLNELKAMVENGTIKSFEDRENFKVPDSYSLMFVDWKEILGYQVAPESFDYVNQLDLAAVLLYEMTFFGYDYEENQDTSEKEEEELERLINEIKNGDTENYKTIKDIDEWFLELRKENGEFDGKTEEEVQSVLKQEKMGREEKRRNRTKVMLEDLQTRYEILKKLKGIYCKGDVE